MVKTDKKFIIKKLKEEIENLKLNLEIFEATIVDFEEIEINEENNFNFN